MMAGIDMIHVPYRGGNQVVTDLIAGQVRSFHGAFCGQSSNQERQRCVRSR